MYKPSSITKLLRFTKHFCFLSNINCQEQLKTIYRYVNSPAFRDSHPHKSSSFISPTLPMFHRQYWFFTRILQLSSKKYPTPTKKNMKKQKKSLFIEKKALGKTPLYHRSFEYLTTLCTTSVYLHFFFVSLSSLLYVWFIIVYKEAPDSHSLVLTLNSGGGIL